MSAVTLPAPRRPALPAALRTVVTAGGWSNAMVLASAGIGPLLAWLDLGDQAARGGLLASAILTLFWAMLAGARLLALAAGAAQERLPYWRRQAWLQGLMAAALGVLLPATLHAAAAPGIALGYALAGLGAGAALGLLWVSMPPWLMWVFIAASAGLRWLPGELDDSTLEGWMASPVLLGATALALLGMSAACWVGLARRRTPAGQWSTPLALAFGRPAGAMGSPWHATRSGAGAGLLAQDTPVGTGLHREPGQALAIALGPGFGRNTAGNVLAAQGPMLAVAALWLLLGSGAGGKLHVGLMFAPLMVLSAALAPLVRLHSLFWRPALGLHELALLPGLPRQPARWLSGLLVRQMIVRGLPTLAVMAGFGLAIDAPRPYYPLLLWSSAAGAALLAGATVACLHWRAGRWIPLGLAMLLVVALVAGMLVGLRTPALPAWLHGAWSLALLAGVVVHLGAVGRLRHLPHPWLQH